MKRRHPPAPADKNARKLAEKQRQAADRFATYMTEDGFSYLDWMKQRPVLDPRYPCTLAEVGGWTVKELCDVHIILNGMTAAGL